MPLYEYECSTCHQRTEKIQKFSDPEITLCPKCGGALDRVISAPAISFKGGGWFADGYGNAKPAGASGGGSEGGSPDSGGKGGTGTESKAPNDSTGTAPQPVSAPVPPTPAAGTSTAKA